ncbi:MAG TPA: 3-phosphoshikimate 1-carboxyvinyltransferase [Streptosporangiaceae bacterium]
MISHAPGEDFHGSGTPDDWLVPRASGPVRALVRLPGSKSMTNRALVLAALSDRPTLITGPLVARDTRLMAGALRALGCRITESADGWRVEPAALGLPGGPASPRRAGIDIDVGNAGTVLRFVPPLAALTHADVTFRGDARVSKRPVGPLLAALRTLGATVSDDGTGTVPFAVRGHGSVPGGTVTLDASSSSQLVSGLLLAAARFGAGAEIRHSGPPVPSAPHIEMTVRMLRSAGVDVRAGDSTVPAGASPGRLVTNSWRVLPGPISTEQIDIEPDLSNAVPFLAAALATGGEVTVAEWPADSLQPAARIIELLQSMGAEVHLGADGLRVTGSGLIYGVSADLSEVGELPPVLTALAALASSPSEFTGIGHLRRHESDRLAALASEIGKLGGDVTELPDGLRIRPAPLHANGVTFDSHDDHRLVMAAAVLGLVTDGMRVRNAATVGKTFPGFSRCWTQILAPA